MHINPLSGNRLYSLLVTFVLATLVTTQTVAQSITGFNPLSRFGYGSLVPQQSVRNQGMGGAGNALPDPDFVNFQNPALLGYQRLSNLEIGLNYVSNTWQDSSSTHLSRGGGLSYFALTVPLTNQLTSSISFQPLSVVDYTIRLNSRFADSALFAKNSQGRGGLNRVNLGFGYNFENGLSLGVQPSFIFGQIQNIIEYRVVNRGGLPDHSTYFNSSTSVADVVAKIGANYRVRTDSLRNTYFSAGGYAEFGRSLGGSRLADLIYLPGNSSTGFRRGDTLIDGRDQFSFPSTYSFGLSYSRPLYWGIAADVTYQTFTSGTFAGERLPFQNSLSASLGGEWTPNAYSQNYLGICTYRGGVAYAQLPVVINNTQLEDYSFSVGVTAPITRKEAKFTRPYLNAALTVGQQGNRNTAGLQNAYLRLSFSVTLNDATWFKRYKHD